MRDKGDVEEKKSEDVGGKRFSLPFAFLEKKWTCRRARDGGEVDVEKKKLVDLDSFFSSFPLIFFLASEEAHSSQASLSTSMRIPEPSPGGGDSGSFAPGSFSLSAGGDDKGVSLVEPQRQRVGGGEERGGEKKNKTSRDGGDDNVDRRSSSTTKKRRAPPPPPHQQQHWAASLAASAGGPLPVLLGLGVAVATVTVARAVVATQGGKRRSRSGEVRFLLFFFARSSSLFFSLVF